MNLYCIINPVQVLLSVALTFLLLKNIFGYELKPKRITAIIIRGINAAKRSKIIILTLS